VYDKFTVDLFTAVEWRRESGGGRREERDCPPHSRRQQKQFFYFFFGLKLNGHLVLVTRNG
jgi:hypothetical protein